MNYKFLLLPTLALSSVLLTGCTGGDLPTGSGSVISFGTPSAPVKLTEYLDYQCSHCKVFHDTITPVIMKEYVQTGKATLEIKDFPLFATSAITQNAAHCAAKEGKYKEYTDMLFENQQPHTADELKKFAEKVGITSTTFGTCVDNNEFKSIVDKNQSDGIAEQVQGTPSLFVQGQKLEIKAIEDVRQAIDKALEK